LVSYYFSILFYIAHMPNLKAKIHGPHSKLKLQKHIEPMPNLCAKIKNMEKNCINLVWLADIVGL